jgi:hypothetical protein
MATTTPNFGWAVPTSTDYVKDGATAIETLGDAIDARIGNIGTYPNQLVNVVSGVSRPIPFAMSAGVNNVSATNSIGSGPWAGGFFGSASITFPASRFTQTPILAISLNESTGAQSGFVTYSSVTTSGFTAVPITQASGTAGVNWYAIQMTSAASAG